MVDHPDLAFTKAPNENIHLHAELRREKDGSQIYPFWLAAFPVLRSIFICLYNCARCSNSYATRAATQTPQPTRTITATPTISPSPTVTPNLVVTQQYEAFHVLVKKYCDAGHISTTEGAYIELDDYERENASRLSYAWSETGLVAKNFIVQADFEWSNAIDTVNTSGCGFIFRLQPNQDYYIIILDAYNGVKLASPTDRGTFSMGSPQNGEQKLADFGAGPYQVTFTLIVNELQTYAYVDDVYFGEYQLLEYRIRDSGALANAVLSAISEGYGTRYKMTNVRAWVIVP